MVSQKISEHIPMIIASPVHLSLRICNPEHCRSGYADYISVFAVSDQQITNLLERKMKSAPSGLDFLGAFMS